MALARHCHRYELERFNQACWNGEDQQGLVRPQPLDVTARMPTRKIPIMKSKSWLVALSRVGPRAVRLVFPLFQAPLRSSLAPGAEHLPVSCSPVAGRTWPPPANGRASY